MICKVLRSKYRPSKGWDPYGIPLKRAFFQMDITRRGWLSMTIVQDLFAQAAWEVHRPISTEDVARLIENVDENNDHHINIGKFLAIAAKVYELVMVQIEGT